MGGANLLYRWNLTLSDIRDLFHYIEADYENVMEDFFLSH